MHEIPGFRSNVNWKPIKASLVYVLLSHFCVDDMVHSPPVWSGEGDLN